MWVSMILTLVFLGAFIWWIISIFKPSGKISDTGNMICPSCGTRGEPRQATKGSIVIELILWICLIVPGLIYSFWRLSSRHSVCPSCGQPGMIAIATPRGQILVKQFAET